MSSQTTSEQTTPREALSYPWLKSIHINKIRHLEEVDIRICDDAAPRHLLVTGPNGSGKTSLLLATKRLLEQLATRPPKAEAGRPKDAELVFDIAHFERLAELLAAHGFVIAYYSDFRRSSFKEVSTPEKPTVKHDISKNNGDEFLKFLVNLKIQQALAKNEANLSDAGEIEAWFEDFTEVLRMLFDDSELRLVFNYKDYSFNIITQQTSFPFTGLSAGYAAALDIVADLILRMQDLKQPKRVFDLPGIVLIDEIETHLHLSLQQKIMPILTRLFPKLQFVVSTHSPFVLNSIANATIYDLKNRECVRDLTDYSYDALAEGYFEVETASGELTRRLDTLDALIHQKDRSKSDVIIIDDLIADFDKLPDWIAPAQKARFLELKHAFLSGAQKR